jgi:hypothetical protein
MFTCYGLGIKDPGAINKPDDEKHWNHFLFSFTMETFLDHKPQVNQTENKSD